MRAPKAINFLKNNITENIISKINKLADGIGCLSPIPRNPLNIERYAILETNLKAWRSSSWKSDFLLPLRRMDSTFCLAEYQMTLESDKGLAKASKARQTALSSLQVELWTLSARDQFWWNPKSESDWTYVPQAEPEASEKTHFDRKRLTSPISFTVEGMYIIHPKIDLWNGILRQANFAIPGKVRVHNWNKRCLVTMRQTDATQLESEIIWPATLATVLTWLLRGGGWDDNVPRSVINSTIYDQR